jgi:hypothetical protein
MGRVRCVKPKADGVSVVKTMTAKKKVARKKSKVGGIKGRTKVMAQKSHDYYATGVCWGL